MKRLIIAITLILLAASLFALKLFLPASNPMSEQQKEAVFAVVGESTHDFKTIKEADGPVTHTFKIKNEGKAPLVITNVTASCGCTSPDWTKQPIAPGKIGEVKVTYDPAGRPNPFSRPVAVYSNGHKGSYNLTIKGNVEAKKIQ